MEYYIKLHCIPLSSGIGVFVCECVCVGGWHSCLFQDEEREASEWGLEQETPEVCKRITQDSGVCVPSVRPGIVLYPPIPSTASQNLNRQVTCGNTAVFRPFGTPSTLFPSPVRAQLTRMEQPLSILNSRTFWTPSAPLLRCPTAWIRAEIRK